MHYNLRDADVTVVGMARSGIAASLLLKELGAKVTVIDSSDSQNLRENRDMLLARGIKAEINVTGNFPLGNCSLVVVSPGVREEMQGLSLVKKKNIPIISELELGFQNCRAHIIAVTGTNGKTTVATLIGEVLRANGKKAFVCGNIGIPFSSLSLKASEHDFVVLEVSSFQLEKINEFRPAISLILNFSPDHLDRYKRVSDYLEAKKKIYSNQKSSDWVVLNFADTILRSLRDEIEANVLFFNGPSGDLRLRDLNPNQQAVMAVASILKLNKKKSLAVLSKFKGIEHRLENLGCLCGVDFINDSKATNIDSTTWALESIKKPIILIAGGRGKGAKFETIEPLIKEKVKCMVVIGETKELLYQLYEKKVCVVKADSLESAARLAFLKAQSGDCILFSPMCASFDMFLDYEDRGKKFKEIVSRFVEKDNCNLTFRRFDEGDSQ